MIQYLWSKIIKKLRGSSIRNSTIHKTSKIESGSNIYNVSMDKHSFCGYDCEIVNCDIGSFVSIANNVIMGGGMHPVDWVGMSPVFYKGRDSVRKKFSEFEREEPQKITVGNDVWIGNNVLVKQGVNIGHGAVIGMGSVVTKDVDPYTIVAGIPAKKIRNRFDEDISEKLLKIEWWNFDDKKLEEAAKHIKNPTLFLKSLEK
ncbi:Glycosyl transferase family 1 [Tenacibaculum sp. 190524A05c]|uniref:CatB-related O-acetyltransferase n=1 Tax=Tenacibaculum platacis TaxID=3137852 RepID=UPI0031FA77C0